MTKGSLKRGSLADSKDEQELSALMRKTQAGDGEAFKILLTRIEKMLQSFVRKSVSENNAEDVIQEVLLAIHTKRHTFNTEQFFLPWFYAIARYKVIDYIRAKGKEAIIPFDPDVIDLASASEVGAVMDSITVDELEGLLSNLPEKQRVIVKSVKIEGLSIKEAAQKLSLTESDIKISIHRALKTLKTIFSERPNEN